MQVHRDKQQIAYDILKVLSDGGMPKTRVMMMAMLSWNQLKDHLTSLEQLQLIRHAQNSDNKIYMTDKGEAFLNKYERLNEIFDLKQLES